MHLFHPHLRVEVRFLLPWPQWVSVSAQHINHFLCLLAKPIRWQNRRGFCFNNFFIHDVRGRKKKYETKSSLICVRGVLLKPFWRPRTAWRSSDRRYIIYVSINDLCLKGAGCLSLSAAWKTHLFDKDAGRNPWTFPHCSVVHNVGLRS